MRSAAIVATGWTLVAGGATAQTYSQPGIATDNAAAASEAAAFHRLQQTNRRPLSITPSLGLDETYTNNVDLKPSGQQRADFVTTITPALAIDEAGSRTELSGSIALPAFIYARTGGENDRVVPQVNLIGTVEAVEHFFFVEGQAYVSQEYFSPFGGRPQSLVNLTQNEFRQQTYRVTPYIKGTFGGNVHYELRDHNVWNTLTSSPAPTNGSSYTNEVVANIVRDPVPYGWAVEYDRSDTTFKDQPTSSLTELGRVRALGRPRDQLELSVGGGYEHNRYPLSSSDGFIYNVGARWRPTERTALDAFWEHRFFGSSYNVAFDHRTPLTVWRFAASRNLTSYPQQLAQFPAGALVPLLLNSLFSSSIPDPFARAEYILQFMQQHGLPFVLTSPFTLYNQQIYLEERETATAGLIGARNSVFFTAFRVRAEPITAAGTALPPLLQFVNNNTQVGGGVSWTYQLTPLALLGAGVDYLRTTANAPLDSMSEQTNVRLTVTSPISTRTSLTYGARWQDFRSNIADQSWREAAAFVGITHTFR